MPTRLATASDLRYIVSLAERHADAVGFLTRSAMTAYIDRRRVRLTFENGEPCGYFLTGADGPSLRIFQAAVQTDAQHLGHGRELLGDVVTRAAGTGALAVTLHCRDGLDSNAFWAALGFESHGLIFGGGSRRKLVHTWRLSVLDAIRNPALPYARRIVEALSCGSQARTRPGEGRPSPTT